MDNKLEKDNMKLCKKIEHIRDICDEARCFEDVEAMEREFYKIIDICDGKTCSKCRWWQKEDITDGMVCVNADAEDCTCWTDENHTCPVFEEEQL